MPGNFMSPERPNFGWRVIEDLPLNKQVLPSTNRSGWWKTAGPGLRSKAAPGPNGHAKRVTINRFPGRAVARYARNSALGKDLWVTLSGQEIQNVSHWRSVVPAPTCEDQLLPDGLVGWQDAVTQEDPNIGIAAARLAAGIL